MRFGAGLVGTGGVNLPNVSSTHGVYYVIADHLGSPRLVVDSVRNLPVWSWSLLGEAFGQSKPDEDADRDGTHFFFDMRFPGQRFESSSGYNYNYYRDYDPHTGRYIQVDPIGFDGGVSGFAYAAGSPLMFSDPLGLFSGADLPSLPGWLVDGAAGLGDGVSGGLTASFRDWAEIGSVDRCSTSYQGSEWAGVGVGLALPIGRIAYVSKVRQLPGAGMSLEQTVAARNALKSYYRGRPLDSILPRLSGRFGYPTAAEILDKNGRDVARAIARSGGTDSGWTIGLVGGGAAKAANSARNAAERGCGCD